MLGLGDVARALEHDVLEEVGEAGLARDLVLGADVVPEVDRDDRGEVILGHDDAEAVVEALVAEDDLRDGDGHESPQGRWRVSDRYQDEGRRDGDGDGATVRHHPPHRGAVGGEIGRIRHSLGGAGAGRAADAKEGETATEPRARLLEADEPEEEWHDDDAAQQPRGVDADEEHTGHDRPGDGDGAERSTPCDLARIDVAHAGPIDAIGGLQVLDLHRLPCSFVTSRSSCVRRGFGALQRSSCSGWPGGGFRRRAYHRATMTWTTSVRMARLAARTRFVLLALVSLFLGHDAVYAAEHGIGTGFGSAMAELDHGAYWGPFTLLAAASAISLAVGSGLALARLRRRLVRTAGCVPPGPSAPAPAGYRHEFAAIWPRLALVVVVLFALQENVETFLAHGVVPGVDVLFGGELPLAIPVLALVTLGLAAIGALVRWRISVLTARLHRAAPRAQTALSGSGPAPEWAEVHAAAPHRWTLDRRDAGRAPPADLRPRRLATA